MKKILFLLGFTLFSCQTPVTRPVPQSLGRFSLSDEGRAKSVFIDVQNQVAERSSEFWLTHLEGRGIDQNGTHKRGEWIFSYIHLSSGAGLKVSVTQKGMRFRELPGKDLPQMAPLEDRAWGADSDKAILKAKSTNRLVFPLDMSLSMKQDRLVWQLLTRKGPVVIDAMTGNLLQSNG